MNNVTNIPAPYAHQKTTTDFIVDTKCCLITSDPGTGKTRAVLDAHVALGGRALVLAPLSILEAAWGEDISKFQPNIKYGVAYAKNRKQVFEDGKNEIIFYKSQSSGRWWMGVPFKKEGKKQLQNYFVACSYHDYEVANQGEVPDRWIKTYKKFI